MDLEEMHPQWQVSAVQGNGWRIHRIDDPDQPAIGTKVSSYVHLIY